MQHSLQDKEDEGCLMFYMHGCVQILKWDKNLGKSDKDGVDEEEVKAEISKEPRSKHRLPLS
ncbi:hypothetical protein Tsubulata_050769 [Turnera subulata]|uniref:Uncharacterized protein n=1 Tax=Turnera subulata TaxID=218843 RepID=A0A9Q0F1N1_9ROSI|nr:hypothetical protein Tsubulata_050769 [Turnera subulata]